MVMARSFCSLQLGLRKSWQIVAHIRISDASHDADRDSGKWNLSEDETYRRRNLFYELYTYDSWQVSWSYCCCSRPQSV